MVLFEKKIQNLEMAITSSRMTRTLKSIFFVKQNEQDEVRRTLSELLMNT